VLRVSPRGFRFLERNRPDPRLLLGKNPKNRTLDRWRRGAVVEETRALDDEAQKSGEYSRLTAALVFTRSIQYMPAMARLEMTRARARSRKIALRFCCCYRQKRIRNDSVKYERL